MTELEWLNSIKPSPMLLYLLGADYPRVQDVETFPNCKGSDRKMRLFACACYFHIRHLLPNPLAHLAVEVAMRFAEGKATTEELRQVSARLWKPIDALESRWRASRGARRTALQPTHEALALASVVAWSEAPKAAYYASSNSYLAIACVINPDVGSSEKGFSASQISEEKAQTDILRCIFGNLFRPIALEPSWLDATVDALAHSAYANRNMPSGELDSARLAVLSDALEDAGCTNAALLSHLRSPGPHVRGCWALDILLAKE